MRPADAARAPLWPLDIVEANLMRMLSAADGPALPPAVLLTTGAMNPVHHGHIQLLSVAAQALGRRFTVLGAFLSPTHGQYLRHKFRRGPSKVLREDTDWLADAVRLALCDAALADSTLIRVGRYECGAQRFIDFPTVARALQEHLDEVFQPWGLPQPITVIYCAGQDHFTKCCLERGLGDRVGVCCISRSVPQPHASIRHERRDSPRGGSHQVVRDGAVSAADAVPSATSQLRVLDEERSVFAAHNPDLASMEFSSSRVRRLLSSLSVMRTSQCPEEEGPKVRESCVAQLNELLPAAVAAMLIPFYPE